MELDVRVYSDDKSLKPNHELYGWGDMFIGCSERAGDRSLRTHETMRGAIEKAGFIDVHEVKYKIPLGPWAKDKLLKEAGHLQFAHWNAALEGWAMWLLTHHGMPEPWTKEEVQVFLAKIRTELKNPHIHAYEPAYVDSHSVPGGFFGGYGLILILGTVFGRESLPWRSRRPGRKRTRSRSRSNPRLKF
jgi:hypothetical protein